MAISESMDGGLSRTRARAKAEGRRRHDPQRAATLLKQLCDPTRLQILQVLDGGERHVGGLCDELGLVHATVSHHLSLLRHGGLVVARRRGKNTFYELTGCGRTLAGVVADVMASCAVRR